MSDTRTCPTCLREGVVECSGFPCSDCSADPSVFQATRVHLETKGDGCTAELVPARDFKASEAEQLYWSAGYATFYGGVPVMVARDMSEDESWFVRCGVSVRRVDGAEVARMVMDGMATGARQTTVKAA